MSDRTLSSLLGTTLPARLAAGLLLLVVSLGAWFLLSRPSLPVRSAPLVARLELTAGPVTLKSEGDTQAVFSGTALTQDATLEAGEGARALLRLASGAAVFLRGGSILTLTEAGLHLTQGELWVDAPPAERKPVVWHLGPVEITAADAGFNLKHATQDGQSTVSVYVARGTAVITSPGGRIEAQAGEQATVLGQAKPSLSPVAFWNDWTGGMGDHPAASALAGSGAGTLYGVVPGGMAGAAAQPLEVSRQAVRSVIRQSFAETEVAQTFFNPGDQAVEGWYWFTLPPGASVTGFALETDGVLVEGELIERRDAVAQYGAAIASGHEPALLEWIDARTYRARIFPVPQGGSRRVVVRYLELLPLVGGRLRYVYPLQTQRPVRIGEFSLSVDLGEDGTRMDLSTLAEARIEDGGRRVTVRRSGFTPRADFQLEGIPRKQGPAVTVSRTSVGDGSADYLMLRYMPDVDLGAFKAAPGQVVVVVDTSAAGDEANRALKISAAEAILRALSESDRFALVSLDVDARVVHPQVSPPAQPEKAKGASEASAEALAPATDAEISVALERLADHPNGGATDLSQLFGRPLELLHGFEQPAIVYVGDGVATSGELSSEQLVERLRSTLAGARARLFTVGVGSDANTSLLSELARAGGGQAYRIEAPEQATERALHLTASLKAPTLTELDIDFGAGLDEVFLSANGKVTRGDEVILLARTHNELPRKVTVKGRLGGKSFEHEHSVVFLQSSASSLVPRLWAAEFMRRLTGNAESPEQVRGKITSMGIDYGLMTPYTSFLALESEAAYQQQGIQRRFSPLRGTRLAMLEHADQTIQTALNPVAPDVSGTASDTDPLHSALKSTLTGMGMVLATTSIGCSAQEPPSYQEQAPPAEYEAKRVRALGYVSSASDASAGGAAPAAMPAAPPPAPKGMDDSPARRPEASAPALEAQSAATGAAPGGLRQAAKKDLASSLDEGHTGEKSNRADAEAVEADLKSTRHAPGARPVTGACSDLSERPLTERAVLWRQRLNAARSPSELLARLEAARYACELADWRAEALFYRLLEKRIQDEGTAVEVLTALGAQPEAQRYLARLILRRAVDVRLVAAVERVLFGARIDWVREDLNLSALADPGARVTAIKALLVRAPEDPEGLIRLVRTQAEAGQKEDALQTGRRLTELGLMTPAIARQLGDVLAAQGQADDAIRAYSEIVEFDAANPGSRRMLGDIFLANAWYQPAYRQYKLLTDAFPQDSLLWLRLASAAAGEGRVDEALRIERSVAEKEGTPGPSDPRRFARLLSAARLAGLLAKPPEKTSGPSGEELERMVSRKLKELQLFRGPGTLVLLTWEDLDAQLELGMNVAGRDSGAGERMDAAPAGLASMLLAPGEAQGADVMAHVRSVPLSRPVRLKRHDLIFDGKSFSVAVKELTLPARGFQLGL